MDEIDHLKLYEWPGLSIESRRAGPFLISGCRAWLDSDLE
ncbi:Uncharacterized protein AC505_4252 [Pseudomonas syringae pv. maculicola]|nr:Uncharacterized protein AC505_4252 [Pseudomonas syringae pv. maculicola]